MTVPSPYADRLRRLPVQRHEVEVRGATTAYWVYGPEDAETTVIAVHGFRGEHHGLEPVLAYLPEVCVVAPDLPGFGESSPLPGCRHDLDEYAGWLTDFAAEVAPGAVILGHSFGSIVVAAAVADGLATPRVILINPIAAPALEGPNGFMSRLTLLYYRLGRALPSRIGAALLGNWVIVQFMSVFLAQSKDPAVRRFTHDQHHTYFSRYATRDSVVEGFEASISSDVSMFAARISQPTLLIGADNDPITTVAAQRRLETLFPDARLTILTGVGHLVHYEKPAEAARAIVDFLGAGRVAQ